MLVWLVAVAWALRLGLVLRRTRRRRLPRPRDLRQRHLRAAKVALGMVAAGAALGLGSGVTLRGMEPLRSFHGMLALLVLLLFGGAALLGRRLEQRRSRAFDAHALLALLGALFAALAAVAGFAILP